MRNVVRRSLKGGLCAASNQYFISTISHEVFNVISKDLDINGNICEILDEYFEYANKQRERIENEYGSQFDDYPDNEEERTKHSNEQLNKLAIQKRLQKLNLNDVMLDFDATSLFPSAMWDKNSVYPKIETGFAFKPHMNKTYVDAFIIQTFNQDDKESAILKKYYNPPEHMFQHLPVEEKVKNIEINRMRTGYVIDRLTSVDIVESW